MAVDATESAPKVWQPRKAIVRVLGIGALACAVGVIPALFDAGHTLDDITHSLAVQAGLAITFLFLVIVLGSVGLRGRADAGRSPWPVYWGILGTLFAVGMSAIMLPSMSAHQLAVDLDARGVAAQARVVRQFIKGCGRSGCLTELEYAYSVQQYGRTFRNFAGEGQISERPSGEYEYILSQGKIPILYDPKYPGRSEANWNGEIHRRATVGISGVVAFLIVLLLACMALVAGLLYPTAEAASRAKSGMI